MYLVDLPLLECLHLSKCIKLQTLKYMGFILSYLRIIKNNKGKEINRKLAVMYSCIGLGSENFTPLEHLKKTSMLIANCIE